MAGLAFLTIMIILMLLKMIPVHNYLLCDLLVYSKHLFAIFFFYLTTAILQLWK